MRFAKYHGIGNDFVLLSDPDDRVELSARLVRALCDRRFGIGADGVIRVAPASDGAELAMDYRNSDGSIGEMCGNGIRCLAVFAREQGLTDSSDLKVATGAGLKLVQVLDDGRVRVDMGAPVFDPPHIPFAWDQRDALRARIDVGGTNVELACLSMGNPHAIIFSDDIATAPVATMGPLIENHRAFPKGANVEYARVVSARQIEMRVWERGSGETLACGTGACAATVAARLLAGTDPRVTVALPGGELEVAWGGTLEAEAPVFMTGPVAKVFDGEVDLRAYA